MSSFRREWGAITFVVTVLVGAIAVAISLVIAGAHAPPSATLEPCPSYTPYVVTPTAAATPTSSATASASASPAASASPSATATPSPTPSATPFNPALANCATPPLPPTQAPTPTPPPGTTPTPTAAPATPAPTQLFTPLPS